MVTTGYTDLFQRTVSGGMGVATSGQTYSLSGTAANFSVASGIASITANASGTFQAFVDRQTYDIDITGQVALSVIPATNLSTVGFTGKVNGAPNIFTGTMMVATGGAMSLRISKIVAGGLSTLNTTALGLTYVAGTYYNLRFSAVWSRLLQTNVLSAKLWAIGATEPGGWQVSILDPSFTDYTAGTQAGLSVRDEATTPTNIGRFQNVVTRSYSLPMPATTDTMCADPAVTYPKQTSLQSIAAAADTAMSTLDAPTSLAGLFPRVRVSKRAQIITTSQIFISLVFDTVEFNVGTPTNLGYNSGGVSLSTGVWAVTLEVQLAEAASSALTLQLVGGPGISQVDIDMRSNAAISNDQSVGGCGHFSTMVYVTDPVTPTSLSVTVAPVNTATTYTVTYAAMSAIKISDYFA